MEVIGGIVAAVLVPLLGWWWKVRSARKASEDQNRVPALKDAAEAHKHKADARTHSEFERRLRRRMARHRKG
jgi:ABC-type nickel/cobalt efflux system permease component RcnA